MTPYPICPKCQSYMIIHPTNNLWRKCPTCGFCRPDQYYKDKKK